ncbi:hypothetical protein EDD18DRAFT_1335919 [Armillaria luteobubalina]|uniref:Uncharacterized protein n=1 Tax=Armillaria luteobubalina TaxID=153913 RepID=A0AA39UDN6_9AGAR|nr:hypothetical protein EDD18DRAFT_1335919 [Armillaria luteobubalina]
MPSCNKTRITGSQESASGRRIHRLGEDAGREWHTGVTWWTRSIGPTIRSARQGLVFPAIEKILAWSLLLGKYSADFFHSKHVISSSTRAAVRFATATLTSSGKGKLVECTQQDGEPDTVVRYASLQCSAGGSKLWSQDYEREDCKKKRHAKCTEEHGRVRLGEGSRPHRDGLTESFKGEFDLNPKRADIPGKPPSLSFGRFTDCCLGGRRKE